MLKELLVTDPSMETISEFQRASFQSQIPPIMTSWSPWAHTLESTLSSESVRDSWSQPPLCPLHWTQLLRVYEPHSPPPHSSWRDWTWSNLISGSEGSWHEVLLQGRNNSADLSVSSPPVMRIAAEMSGYFLFRHEILWILKKFFQEYAQKY